jgi:hypothetical protein
VITAITLFVVFHISGVEDAAGRASRGCAGRLFRDRVAALIRIYDSGAHAGGEDAGVRACVGVGGGEGEGEGVEAARRS